MMTLEKDGSYYFLHFKYVTIKMTPAEWEILCKIIKENTK